MDKLTLYKLAKLYYIDGLGHQEIANVTGFSRPQVSRMLKEARNCHIVDIKINPPFGDAPEKLEADLAAALGVHSISVVDTSDYAEKDKSSRLSAVSGFAAEYLAALIPSCRKVGVGWGHTIYSVVIATEHNYEPTETKFVPLVGNSGYSEPYYQTNSIVDRLAEKYKSKGEFINTPAFVSMDSVHKYLVEVNGLDRAGKIWEDIDLAFFSLGGIPESNPVISEFPDKQALPALKAYRAVGDFLGHFFKASGEFITVSENIPHIAFPPDRLNDVPRRIRIAMGQEKTAAVRAAASMGIFTDLITDKYTAERILEECAPKPED